MEISKTTEELNKHIGQLFSESLKVSNPVQMLHFIREKMNARGYQQVDREDILCELGQLQKIIGEIMEEMIRIHHLLNHKNQ